MEIKVLLIDDQNNNASRIARYINKLEKRFYENFNSTITRIEMIVKNTPECALDVTKNQKIDLIIWDIELRNELVGHHKYYEYLKTKKYNIPGMVVSGKLTEDINQEIKKCGISVIIDKRDYTDNLAEKIAEEICKLIESPTLRSYYLHNLVSSSNISGNIVIENNTVKISEALNILKKESNFIKYQNLRGEIYEECMRVIDLRNNTDYKFPI